jgi:hypothetical protein
LIPLHGDSVVGARYWTGERLEVRRADIARASTAAIGFLRQRIEDGSQSRVGWIERQTGLHLGDRGVDVAGGLQSPRL